MKTINIKVIDPAGMHARPASILSKEASKFTSDICIQVDDKKSNLKSIMSILSMGILVDTNVTITIEGEDEVAACAAIEEIIRTTKLAA